MPATNPKRTLQLAAEYFSALEALAHRGHGVSLGLLHDTLWSVMPGRAPSAHAVAELLSANGLLEPSPEADGEWEIPPAVADFVLHLARRQRLLAPGELQGLLGDLGQEADALARLVRAQDTVLLEGVALRLIDYVQRAHKLCGDHHSAVLAAVAAVKTRDDRRTLRERYVYIRDIYERHLVHMQHLVDSDGLLDSLLDRVLAISREAAHLIDASVTTSNPLRRLRAHVLQLKRDARRNFHESYNEVFPLYSKLRRDHELAASAAIVLEAFGRRGSGGWNMVAEMPVAYWTEESLFTDYALEDHLWQVQEYTEDVIPPLVTLDTSGVARAPDPLYMHEVIDRLRQDAPVPDVLAWLFASYCGQSETELLCAYQEIASDSSLAAAWSDEETHALFCGVRYSYYPIRIEDGSA
ncbi:hypothetical protein ACFQ3P_25950 [Paraburkholderia sabiae]|uniref:Uncharacterized protein n=1 Tax=Paraburkholderia sabiae TaxID=273251 RepID=A0ABU9QLB6_9BURK|nr:hypothetical protein [Paraburkholderia sabiae]WJZ77354.1 hypothetical protein QEN71_35380 [Paraburkholderia sabiae]CAD6547686.1 hypothetical protein LMG24235_04464 [Paraburkholderia sabiae]